MLPSYQLLSKHKSRVSLLQVIQRNMNHRKRNLIIQIPYYGIINPILHEQLGTLVLGSERQLYSTAKAILCSDQDCADAIQETIAKAFSKIGTLRNDRYAKTWLTRILINECYAILRKSDRFVPLDEENGRVAMNLEPESDYMELYRALHSLKDELQIPMILYYIEGFSIREIAQVLEISEGAVQKRLARARGKLRQDLQEMEVLTI